MSAPHFEIRRNPDESIDEIVATAIAALHIEQMSAGHWWIGIDLADGRQWHVNLSTLRGARIELRAEFQGTRRIGHVQD